MGHRSGTTVRASPSGVRGRTRLPALLLAVALVGLAGVGTLPLPLPSNGPMETAPARSAAAVGLTSTIPHEAAPPPLVTIGNGSGWVNLTGDVGAVMPPTALGAMAYDPDASADILIPGTNSSGCTYAFSNGMWQCTGSWTTAPLAPSLAWDNATSQLIEFGGENPYSHVPENVTESYASSDGAWTVIRPAASPPARWGAGLAWDPSDGVLLLFGGTNGTILDNDTWAFNGTGWTLLHPSASPPARSGGTLVDDPVLNAVVLFGGNGTGGALLNDTWIYQYGSWRELIAPTAPPARVGAYAAYNAPTQSIVVFGGRNDTGIDQPDTWYFENASWVGPAALTYPTPPSRSFGEMAPDPAGNGLLLFGGEAGSVLLGDTWRFYSITPVIQASSDEGEGPLTVNLTATVLGGVHPLSFIWTFGDGGAGYSQNATHYYPSPGRYEVNLTVTDAYAVQGRAARTITDVIVLGFQATLSPSLGFAPVNVVGTSTASNGAPPYAISWRFADGPTLSGATAAFTYDVPGNYPVAVWCNDSFGRSLEWGFVVDVLSNPPTPSLNVTLLANRTLAAAPAVIGFVAGTIGTSPVLGFSWSFGDGTGTIGTNVSHAYDSPGKFVVSVKALGEDGATGSTSQTLVICPPLVVEVNDSVTPGPSGTLVRFNASGSGGFPPYQYFWQFPNGSAAEGANVTGFSAQAGSLDVQLEALDAAGDRLRQSLNVSVAGPIGGGPGPPSTLGGFSLETVTIVAAAAGVGLAVGAVVAAVMTRGRGGSVVTRARSERARPGPPPKARRTPRTGSGPTVLRSPPGRTGGVPRRPPPSG